ncbi:MAG TPA: DUF1330 domain-containing protein [Solirubrobacteraceae bacterium]|jgi:uncharacterized protein (DUF1330 family)|nr:DUF1330 domain-containing protein [Solirubrobacteraceae bacterium]
MPALLIAVLDVHDRAGLEEYMRLAGPTLEPHGATIRAIDEEPEVLEGVWPGTRTVVLEFPTRADLRAWYDSPEYQTAAQVRLRATDTVMVAVDTWK